MKQRTFERQNYTLRNPKHIIVFTLPSVVNQKVLLSPNTILGKSKFEGFNVEKYFSKDLHYRKLPFHFSVEYIDSDYFVGFVEPSFNRSDFIEDLISHGMLRYEFINALTVCIYEDYQIDRVDSRLYDVMGYKLLNSLCIQYDIPPNNILFIDEILVKDVEHYNGEYLLSTSKFFDPDLMRASLNDFRP